MTAESHKAPHYPCHRLAERAFPVLPVLNGTDTRTENVSQLLFVTSIVHSTAKNRERKRQRPKTRFQHLSFPFFSGGILNKNISYDEEERKRLKPENFHK